jgi:ACS family D-galactonate transporter-like MFS transporter
VTYFLSLTLWSLFTLFHGMAVGLKTLLLCRFGLGISEAPCFPVNSRVVSAWFPQQERAKATAVYTVGSISGWPALRRCCSGSWTVSAGGCCSSASAPSAFCLPWCGGAATANRMKIRASASRSASISKTAAAWRPDRPAGGVQLAAGPPAAEQTADHRRQHRPVCRQYRAGVFLTWFPTWLATERHMPWLKVGFFAILPFVAAAGG